MTAASTTKSSPAPTAVQARADREAEAIRRRARELAAAAPPLTDEQIDAVRAILRPLVVGP